MNVEAVYWCPACGNTQRAGDGPQTVERRAHQVEAASLEIGDLVTAGQPDPEVPLERIRAALDLFEREQRQREPAPLCSACGEPLSFWDWSDLG